MIWKACSRLDNLVEFKKSYGNSMAAVTHCLEKFFPKMTIHDIQDFLYVFFPFLFGIYPYTYVTENRQRRWKKHIQNMFCYPYMKLLIRVLRNYWQMQNREF